MAPHIVAPRRHIAYRAESHHFQDKIRELNPMKFTMTHDHKRRPAAALVSSLRRRTRQLAVLALVMATLAGCATSQTARDRALQERAQARWDALLAGDFDQAYAFLSPGYRSGISVTDFEIIFRTRKVQYTSAEYREHSCDEAVCTVKVFVGYKIHRPLTGMTEWTSTSLLEERWINSNGNWWYLPET